MARIVNIEGIDIKYAQILQEFGIKTTQSLLRVASTRKGRADLAEQTRISEKLILKWVNLADLMRIKGVGEEYSDLLEEAGVDSVKELRHRNASYLYAQLLEINRQNPLVRRLPSETDVTDWIRQAEQINPLITH